MRTVSWRYVRFAERIALQFTPHQRRSLDLARAGISKLRENNLRLTQKYFEIYAINSDETTNVRVCAAVDF